MGGEEQNEPLKCTENQAQESVHYFSVGTGEVRNTPVEGINLW